VSAIVAPRCGPGSAVRYRAIDELHQPFAAGHLRPTASPHRRQPSVGDDTNTKGYGKGFSRMRYKIDNFN